MIPGESTPPVVHVSQFDVNSRTLTFNLMKGGVAFVPDAGMSVTLDGMKPDNHVFSYPMTVNGSSVSIDVLTQMTVVSGHVKCEVSVSNQNGKIGSANFILAVEESPIDSGSISESDIPIFEDLKNQAQQAAADAEQSASDAESAASSVSAMMATVESTSIASKAYSVGDYLVLNGKLYEVTRAIIRGGRLTVGTNISETTVGGELTSLNSNLNQKVSSVNGETPDTNGNVSLNAEDIPADGVGSKDVSGNPIIVSDAVAENAQNLSVDLEPIQDLHGYDHPWAGGAGKNKLGSEVYGQQPHTSAGITYTPNLDTDGNIVSLTLNGTQTSDESVHYFYNTTRPLSVTAGTAYTLSIGGNVVPNLTIRVGKGTDNSYLTSVTNKNSLTFTPTIDSITVRVSVAAAAGATYNNVKIYPMFCLASETDPTFEPYSNICPITGRTSVDITRTGKNLFDKNAVTPNAYLNADGVEKPTQTFSVSDYIKIIPNNSITYSGAESGFGTSPRTCYYDEHKNFMESVRLSSRTGTLTPIASYVRFSFANADLNTVQVEIGSSATPYEEYTGQSVTVQLGQTVYGGTLNVSTGELTVETANIASYNGESIGEPWWSSMDEYVPGTTPTTGAQVVYTLATPTTVSLTPAQLNLLAGYNILTTDGDNINLRYTGTVASNVQIEIDEFEESTRTLAGSLAMIETSPATANHAVGSYLMLNNRLCKVTAAIATGEQIIVGSNVQYTTIAEELAAILAQVQA